jgi:predicted ribosomally synthesized peptide with SipW-like signal peptide
MNSTIKKSLVFLVVIVSVVSFVGLTTAYFSDTETSTNNIFQAGSLDLKIGEPVNAVWTAENWLPGDEVKGEIELENVGSLPINSLTFEVNIE